MLQHSSKARRLKNRKRENEKTRQELELAVFEERIVPGVIILRLNNPNAAQVVASLRQLLIGVNAEQIHQAITVVEPHRIRITKLPIG